VRLNDGTRDRQAYSHTLLLGRKKRIEDLVSFSDGIPGPESEMEMTADDAPFISVRPITLRP
jgi:hypothetical protein